MAVEYRALSAKLRLGRLPFAKLRVVPGRPRHRMLRTSHRTIDLTYCFSVPPLQYLCRMLIDCEVCLAKDKGVCGDCVVSFILPLTRGSAETLSLDDEEVEALAALAEQGLVPRLRLITVDDGDPVELAG